MSTRSKLHRLYVFLTPTDEKQLSAEIRALSPALRFVDAPQQPETPAPTWVYGIVRTGLASLV